MFRVIKIDLFFFVIMETFPKYFLFMETFRIIISVNSKSKTNTTAAGAQPGIFRAG